MKQFSDKDGGKWQIDLTIGTVMRVRALDPQFDLLDPTADHGGRPLQVVLAVDLAKFWELLWLIVEPQAEAKDVTAVQFGQLMAADCLLEAQAAFSAEWRDFFRLLRRPDAALSVETQAKTQAAALRLVAAKVDGIDQTKLLTRIESLLEKEISGQFGKMQAALAEIREDTPGGNST